MLHVCMYVYVCVPLETRNEEFEICLTSMIDVCIEGTIHSEHACKRRSSSASLCTQNTSHSAMHAAVKLINSMAYTYCYYK